ncbi:ExbD/TolR family protein [Roseibacillus persicicus]|uniref:ExbD/TolR family protein n=1 Tax=Roseibacillus persicicus TaxID=454148 RepID=UPI00280FEC94|nr:biopolymer transporter ExbD [Roseibacillus persicicus]MDQ8191137.1 biopolymer transporter ExbD [Roseibacillus persicicus]
MRRRKGIGEILAQPRVDVSSLVDISFLLLIYFLVTTTLFAKEQDMPLTLPGSGLASELAPIEVRIESDNRVILHAGEPFAEEVGATSDGRELPRLAERLALLRVANQTVELDVAQGADYQRFMDVLNCLRGEGFDEIGICQH